MNHSAQLRIGLIGPGRAGAPVAAALQTAGHLISHVTAVSKFSKDRAVEFFPTAKIVDPLELVENVDLVIVAVPDNQLTDLVRGLAAPGIRSGQIWLHLSGAHGLLPLLPIIDAGGVALAVHPAMTFTGDYSDVARIQECPFAVTASVEYLPIAQALVLEMGGEPVVVDDVDRVTYHAALSHAANHLNTLVSQSADMLRRIGIEDAGRFLLPLTSNALEHALKSGSAALTGPIQRGDVDTVKLHLIEISDPEIRATYLALARATLKRIEKTLPQYKVAEMLAVFKECE